MSQQLQTINQETGEVTTQETDIILQSASIPEYLTELQRLDIPDEDKLALLSIYESQENARPFKSFLNTEVDVYGGIVWDHPPYRAKNSSPDDPDMPGYQKILILAMDKEGNPFIIDASHGALATHFRAILAIHGWYIWSTPVKYKFWQDEKTNAFRMSNSSRVKAMLVGKKVK